ncbi:hypothetical protein GIB67_000196 [Kingdonia uniflora]|uniref:Uncharacterized protein n=1 Tax=Kingdonia uniflora TaxID=39325 RepID=A0A7J7P9Y9_9MAGN|nr:hypothetical protein GIB67_000196 [Kingdonia uniflora]
MASHQSTKRDDDQPTGVSEQRVSQITHHFESLADEVKSSDKSIGEEFKNQVIEDTKPQEEKKDTTTSSGPSLEDIGKERAQAQQNSMEAIRRAEERHSQKKGKEEARLKTRTEEDTSAKQGQVLYKNMGKTALGYTVQAAKQAMSQIKDGRENSSSRSKRATETAVGIGKHTAEMVVDYSKRMTGKAMEYSKSSASYAGEKAAATKETVVEVGKTTAGTANDAKDVVVSTGLRAAHYTLENTAELTEATVGIERNVVANRPKKWGSMVNQQEKLGKNIAQAKWTDTIGGGGGILGAVGETIVEIGQSAQDIVGSLDP